MPRRPRFWSVFAASTLFVTACGAAVLAETLKIEVDSIEIRSKKGTMWPVVATAKKGDVLTVIEKTDMFYKVQAGDVEGWISTTALAKRPLKANGEGNLDSDASATGLSAGAVGKGIGNEAKAYADANHYDYKAVDHLIDIRKKLSDTKGSSSPFTAFLEAGKVGPR